MAMPTASSRDETGRVVDGDAIMGICAIYLHRQNRLAGKTVVATTMSNLGLELALRREGIVLERTQVGDRYVLERMRERRRDPRRRTERPRRVSRPRDHRRRCGDRRAGHKHYVSYRPPPVGISRAD